MIPWRALVPDDARLGEFLQFGSYPSGHATIGTAFALGLLLVCPARWRPWLAAGAGAGLRFYRRRSVCRLASRVRCLGSVGLVRIVYEPGLRFGGPFLSGDRQSERQSSRVIQRRRRGFYDRWAVPHLIDGSASIPVRPSTFLRVSWADYSVFIFTDRLVCLAIARRGFLEGFEVFFFFFFFFFF